MRTGLWIVRACDGQGYGLNVRKIQALSYPGVFSVFEEWNEILD